MWMRIFRGVMYNWRQGGLRLIAKKSIKKVRDAFYDRREWLVYRINIPPQLEYLSSADIVINEMSFKGLIENRFFKAVSYPEMIRERFRKGERCFGLFIENRLAHVAWLTVGYLHLDIAVPEIREENVAGIYDCFTLPQFRRHGAYRTALAALAKEAEKLKKGSALVAVDPDNLASKAAIERAGFTLESRVIYERRLFKIWLRTKPLQERESE